MPTVQRLPLRPDLIILKSTLQPNETVNLSFDTNVAYSYSDFRALVSGHLVYKSLSGEILLERDNGYVSESVDLADVPREYSVTNNSTVDAVMINIFAKIQQDSKNTILDRSKFNFSKRETVVGYRGLYVLSVGGCTINNIIADYVFSINDTDTLQFSKNTVLIKIN